MQHTWPSSLDRREHLLHDEARVDGAVHVDALDDQRPLRPILGTPQRHGVFDNRPDANFSVELAPTLSVVTRPGHCSQKHHLPYVSLVRRRTVRIRFVVREVEGVGGAI